MHIAKSLHCFETFSKVFCEQLSSQFTAPITCLLIAAIDNNMYNTLLQMFCLQNLRNEREDVNIDYERGGAH